MIPFWRNEKKIVHSKERGDEGENRSLKRGHGNVVVEREEKTSGGRSNTITTTTTKTSNNINNQWKKWSENDNCFYMNEATKETAWKALTGFMDEPTREEPTKEEPTKERARVSGRKSSIRANTNGLRTSQQREQLVGGAGRVPRVMILLQFVKINKL